MTQAPIAAAPTILVVEDEVLIRMDLMEAIREEGLFGYEAGSADEAIRLLERHPEINVLVTDIEMPGCMNGLKLSHYVRDRWPRVRIIVVSGHIRVRAEQMPAGAIFMSKPYEMPVLQRALHSL